MSGLKDLELPVDLCVLWLFIHSKYIICRFFISSIKFNRDSLIGLFLKIILRLVIEVLKLQQKFCLVLDKGNYFQDFECIKNQDYCFFG